MPACACEYDVARISPSGKLLAVNVDGALQIFHFNGAAPITQYGGPLFSAPDWGMGLAWDNNNHLYALDNLKGFLVYTITPTSITGAPGSPYMIPGLVSNSFIVVPK